MNQQSKATIKRSLVWTPFQTIQRGDVISQDPNADSETDLQLGTLVLNQQFSVIGKLAQGGMAEVYLVKRRQGTDRQSLAVIKRVRPHLANDTDFVAMFTNEARLAAKINHENVVSIYEIGQDGDNWMIAMEYLDGRDMLQLGRACRVHNKAVPFDVSARILADACKGLHHAHQLKGDDGELLNLVHRDMSPENILVTFDGKVKVVDFGIAKARDNTYRTQAGQIKGKLGYVAPEAIRGEVLDSRADIFAIGATLYLFLCGRPAFTGKNPMEIFSKSLEPAPAPSQFNPRIPKLLEEICMKCLAQDRNQRYANCGELSDALEEHIKSTGRALGSSQLAQFMRILFPPDVDPLRQKILLMTEQAMNAERQTAQAQGREAESIDPEATVAGISLSEIGLGPETAAPIPTHQGPPAATNQVPQPVLSDEGSDDFEDLDLDVDDDDDDEDKTMVGVQIPLPPQSSQAAPSQVVLSDVSPVEDAGQRVPQPLDSGSHSAPSGIDLSEDISGIGDLIEDEGFVPTAMGHDPIDSDFEDDMDATVVGAAGLPSIEDLANLDLSLSDDLNEASAMPAKGTPPPLKPKPQRSNMTQPVRIDGFLETKENAFGEKSVEIDEAKLFAQEATMEGSPDRSNAISSLRDENIINVQSVHGEQEPAPPELEARDDAPSSQQAMTRENQVVLDSSMMSQLEIDSPSAVGASIEVQNETDEVQASAMQDSAAAQPVKPSLPPPIPPTEPPAEEELDLAPPSGVPVDDPLPPPPLSAEHFEEDIATEASVDIDPPMAEPNPAASAPLEAASTEAEGAVVQEDVAPPTPPAPVIQETLPPAPASVDTDPTMHSSPQIEIVYVAPSMASRVGMFLVGAILGTIVFGGALFAKGDLKEFLDVNKVPSGFLDSI